MSGLLASFEHLDSTLAAIKGLRKAGFAPEEITAYSPLPEHHIEEALGYRSSIVRVFALVGGLTGAAGGFAFTTFTSVDWPLVTGGKPIVSIPAYVIIAFEMTILFGALSTVIGLFIASRLPDMKPAVIYDPEFSAGRFGVYVDAEGDRLAKARDIFQKLEPAELRDGSVEASHG